MKIYDVSVSISPETPVYEGDPRIKLETASAIARGDAANVTALHFGAHTATHVCTERKMYRRLAFQSSFSC
jgi:arylformamidase